MFYFYDYGKKRTYCLTEQEAVNFIDSNIHHAIHIKDMNYKNDDFACGVGYNDIVYSQNPDNIRELFEYELELLDPDASFDEYDEVNHWYNQIEDLNNLIKKYAK